METSFFCVCKRFEQDLWVVVDVEKGLRIECENLTLELTTYSMAINLVNVEPLN